jgi:hypothetical protein
VHRWGLLRKPITASIGLAKTTALVMCLCRLHNYCIDQRDGDIGSSISVPPPTARDQAEIAMNGGVPLNERNYNSPDQLLHGGEHFDGVSRGLRRRAERAAASGGVALPRDILHESIIQNDLRRPTPASWRRT